MHADQAHTHRKPHTGWSTGHSTPDRDAFSGTGSRARLLLGKGRHLRKHDCSNFIQANKNCHFVTRNAKRKLFDSFLLPQHSLALDPNCLVAFIDETMIELSQRSRSVSLNNERAIEDHERTGASSVTAFGTVKILSVIKGVRTILKGLSEIG